MDVPISPFLFSLTGGIVRLYALSQSCKVRESAEILLFVFPVLVPRNAQVCVPSPNPPQPDPLSAYSL